MNKNKYYLIVFFIVVFVVSFIWHIPASWTLNKLEIAQKISKTPRLQSFKLSNVSGYWWNGTAVVYRAGTKEPLIKLQWTLTGISWLWLNPRINFNLTDFYQNNEKLEFSLQVGISQQLAISRVKSDVKFSTLYNWLSEFKELNVLQAASGKLKVISLQVDLLLKNDIWPQHAEAKIRVLNVEGLGIRLDKTEINIIQKQQDLYVTLKSQDKESTWKLKGTIIVTPKLQYQLDMFLNAKKGKKLPEWSELFMHKITSTKAEAHKKGMF